MSFQGQRVARCEPANQAVPGHGDSRERPVKVGLTEGDSLSSRAHGAVEEVGQVQLVVTREQDEGMLRRYDAGVRDGVREGRVCGLDGLVACGQVGPGDDVEAVYL